MHKNYFNEKIDLPQHFDKYTQKAIRYYFLVTKNPSVSEKSEE